MGRANRDNIAKIEYNPVNETIIQKIQNKIGVELLVKLNSYSFLLDLKSSINITKSPA